MRITSTLTSRVVAFVLSLGSLVFAATPGIEILPFRGQSEILSFSATRGRVSIWRCDFQVDQIDTLTVSAFVVEGASTETLGEVTIPISKACKGTVYFPYSIENGVFQLMSLGVTTDDVQRDVSLKAYKLKDGFTLSRTLSPSGTRQLKPRAHEVLWVMLFDTPRPNEAVPSPSPFNSMDFDDVVKTAKALKEASVVIVSVQSDKVEKAK